MTTAGASYDVSLALESVWKKLSLRKGLRPALVLAETSHRVLFVNRCRTHFGSHSRRAIVQLTAQGGSSSLGVGFCIHTNSLTWALEERVTSSGSMAKCRVGSTY